MKKWYVKMKETNWKEVVIVASTRQKAYEVARKLYSIGAIVMDADRKSELVVLVENEAPREASAYYYENDDEWAGYLDYLKTWTEENEDLENYGESPMTFDEWCDVEYGEEDEDA